MGEDEGEGKQRGGRFFFYKREGGRNGGKIMEGERVLQREGGMGGRMDIGMEGITKGGREGREEEREGGSE